MGQADIVRRFDASRTTGVRVVRTTTRSWDFPYCQSCACHASRWQARNSWFGILILPALAWIYPLIDDASAALASAVIGVTTIGCLALAIAIRQRRIKDAQAAARSTCATLGDAVAFDGWDGSVQVFQFANRDYGKEFMRQNFRKLVNADPSVLAEFDQR
jgi:hypothetical protein